jgi:hypothetical protein
MQLIGEYSNRRLSYPSDRLPAIQGIVAEFQNRLDDTYVAGLWSKDLIRSIAWESRPNYDSPPDLSRAPSWSWASLNGGVCFSCEQNLPYTLLGSIVSIDPNLRVKVLAPLSLLPLTTSKFTFAYGPRAYFTMSDSTALLNWNITMDQWRMKPLHQVCSTYKGFYVFPGSARFEEFQSCMKDVFLLHILSHSFEVEGLVITPEPGQEKGTYRRIGYFRVSHSPDGHSEEPFWTASGVLANLERYIEAIQPRKNSISPNLYRNWDQKGKYTVYLI